MEHSLRLDRVELAVRPWRAAVFTLVAIAAVQLVLLLIAGGALLVGPDSDAGPTARPDAATASATSAPAAKPKPVVVPAASLQRTRVAILVLNGTGRQGAGAAIASRATGRGYRVRAVGNAPAANYPRSIVMYRPGFAGEGQRLARDLGIGVVGPLDGMRAGQLQGAHAVLILGG